MTLSTEILSDFNIDNKKKCSAYYYDFWRIMTSGVMMINSALITGIKYIFKTIVILSCNSISPFVLYNVLIK